MEEVDNKILLLPTQLEHIRACIDSNTKLQIMQKICIFYSEFLKEYYYHASKLEKHDVKQAYLESATMRYMQTSTTTFLDATTKTKIGDEMGRRPSTQMMMNNLKQLGGLGTIYERMQNNLRNIEHCLSFYVDRAGTVDDEGA